MEELEAPYLITKALELSELCADVLSKLDEMDKKLSDDPSSTDKRITIQSIASLLEIQDTFIRHLVEMDATTMDNLKKLQDKLTNK